MTEQLYRTTTTRTTEYDPQTGNIVKEVEVEVVEPYFHSGGILPNYPSYPFITYGSGTISTSGEVDLQGKPITNVNIELHAPEGLNIKTLANQIDRELKFNDNSTKGNTDDIS